MMIWVIKKYDKVDCVDSLHSAHYSYKEAEDRLKTDFPEAKQENHQLFEDSCFCLDIEEVWLFKKGE